MAGVKPFFLTGANAKVRINGKTLAYVTNLSYSVTVNHATPIVLGMYEASSVEPLSYRVNGSFTVVRYVADIVNDISDGSSRQTPPGVDERGNGIGGWGPEGSLQKFGAGFDIKKGVDGRVYENLNPGKLKIATTFDIDVYQKYAGVEGAHRSVAKIRDVRITKADFNIGAKTAANQTFNFTAIYADEDSFIADFSGNGQQFT